jgi:hypothetical protein
MAIYLVSEFPWQADNLCAHRMIWLQGQLLNVLIYLNRDFGLQLDRFHKRHVPLFDASHLRLEFIRVAIRLLHVQSVFLACSFVGL